MPNNTIYKKSSDYVFRNIADEMILVPIKSNTADLNCIFSLNTVAGRIYELIDGKLSMMGIKKIILQEFEVGEEELTRDLQELTDNLQELGAITKS